ncbi:putative TB2/DP1, HVA22 family protein [Giardia muris]|uniref:Putative TB2/DP1, HVA22 family protein n=1 Tax=Giardia muris TaxID=5742 RepID=A0A4Z1T7X3_GIAMU|nr:putative TB2/DP1, HVA22 family protein [Giardia muris]|eukprot:TNJ28679.1 putative TB2/DP1, HVA22 family protein [Giardia muris]
MISISSISRATRNLFCFIIPAYKSYFLLRLYNGERRRNPDVTAKIQEICVFWLIVALSLSVEVILDQIFTWVPGYELFKFAYFYHLGQRDFHYACLLYRVYIAPSLTTFVGQVQKATTYPFAFLSNARTGLNERLMKFNVVATPQ